MQCGRRPMARRPRTAVVAIGEGLAALHEQLPYEWCPFDWTTTGRLASALVTKGDDAFDRTHWNAAHLPLTDTEVAGSAA